MAASISKTLIPCLKLFNEICHKVQESKQQYSVDGLSAVSWLDELGRLRVWAANIGAHQTGQSSLEFRLRDASHISQQITNLLKDLNQTLTDVSEELLKAGSEPSEDDATSDCEVDESLTSELQQLYEETINIIDCLYQLSMLIRKPAQHDLLVGSSRSDVVAFEPFDKEHVRNKYMNAEDIIIQRLGLAITRRRKYLKYRHRHHAKLGKGIEELSGNQRIGTVSVLSETIATDFTTTNINFEETSSNSGLSQTSYAPSLVDGGPITIPPPPRESAAGKPFECPYCFFVIDVRGALSWTRHIFRDIKPYICTYTDCRTPDRLYESRREWFSHLNRDHPIDLEALTCPLCQVSTKTLKHFERHVARHLEELALFALPRNEMDDDDYADKFDTGNFGLKDNLDDDGFESGREAGDDNTGSMSSSDSSISHSSPIPFRHDPEVPESLDPHGLDPEGLDPGDLDLEGFDLEGPPPRERLDALRLGYDPSDSPSDTRQIPITRRPSGEEQENQLAGAWRRLYGEKINKSSKLIEESAAKRNKNASSSLGEVGVDPEEIQEFLDMEEENSASAKKEQERARVDEELRKKEEERARADEEHRNRARVELEISGFDAGEIDRILEAEMPRMSRPTWVKVHRKHLSPETLNEYELPWEWDENDSHYMIIKRWIRESDQDILFEHTRRLRERKAQLNLTGEADDTSSDLVEVTEEHHPPKVTAGGGTSMSQGDNVPNTDVNNSEERTERQEGPKPRRSKTRIPRRRIQTAALAELDYHFEEDKKDIIIPSVLSKEQIDEVVYVSKERDHGSTDTDRGIENTIADKGSTHRQGVEHNAQYSISESLAHDHGHDSASASPIVAGSTTQKPSSHSGSSPPPTIHNIIDPPNQPHASLETTERERHTKAPTQINAGTTRRGVSKSRYTPVPSWWCGWCPKPHNGPMTIGIHKRCINCRRARDAFSDPPPPGSRR